MTAGGGGDAGALGSRHLLRLAGSAFIVLAAEPSYVLVDTVVVGHLGPVALGALGVAGTLLSLVALLGVFLDYSTTGRAARFFGAGERGRAVDEGVAATLLALALGAVGALVGEIFAGPLIELLAGQHSPVVRAAEGWFRIAVLGLPGSLVVLAGNGWMRGVQETRTPVRIVVAANLASAVASPVLVYPLGLGLDGSAIANLAAQLLGGTLFLLALRAERRPWRPRREALSGQLRAGRDLVVRAAGFQAALLTAAAVAARMGTPILAANQVGLQCWELTALVLDSFAIAAQSVVGAALGADDAQLARRVAWQVARYGLYAGGALAAVLAAGFWLAPALFTSSPAVRHQIELLWPFFCLLQPVGGVVFALDGVLVGAGDVRFLRTITLVALVGVWAPLAVAALELGWGIEGIWAGLSGQIATRLVGMVTRTARGSWAVTGTAPLT